MAGRGKESWRSRVGSSSVFQRVRFAWQRGAAPGVPGLCCAASEAVRERKALVKSRIGGLCGLVAAAPLFLPLLLLYLYAAQHTS